MSIENLTTKDTARRPRRRSGCAKWHMSAEAVTVSVPDVILMTDRECLDFLVKVRFGDWASVGCAHCGTVGKHYWRALEKRWKCMGCGSCFSITSGTVFSHRKKSLREIITSVLMWVNSAGGQPALELKRHMKVSYATAFTMQHKMREAMVRGYNVGLLSGDIEVDGAHQCGHRSAEKRGKPQGSRPMDASTPLEKLNETMLTQTGKMKARTKKGGVVNPEFGRTLPEGRRLLFSARKRSGVRGKGASATRVAVGMAESAPVVEAIMKSYVAIPESYLNTDSCPAYAKVGARFIAHRTVEHSKELSGPNGENNNQAEEFNGRFDRMERGTHLHIGEKYVLDYAAENAFRSDTRRLPNGRQLELALNIAMSVGRSKFWKGFTHGNHRGIELTLPLPRLARASGPAKGRSPISSANGRPPR
jgi:transposase-like protein